MTQTGMSAPPAALKVRPTSEEIAQAIAERMALWSKPWLSIEELAIYLGKSVRTARRFLEMNMVRERPVTESGRCVVVRRADVDRALERARR